MSADPSFEWLEREGDRRVARVWIDADLVYFEGHFPGKPILPGIVQVNWALDACESQWQMDSAFAGMSRVKFRRPVAPATWLELSLQRTATARDASNVGVRFAFSDGAEIATEGMLHFRA